MGTPRIRTTTLAFRGAHNEDDPVFDGVLLVGYTLVLEANWRAPVLVPTLGGITDLLSNIVQQGIA